MSWWKFFSGKKTIVNSAVVPEPRRLLLQALEPRMMFDGVAVTTTTATADASHADTASHTTASVSVAQTHTDTTTAAASSTADTTKATSSTTASGTTASTSSTTTQDSSKTSGSSVASGTSSATGPQVVFVESDVKDYQSLVSQLPSGYEVVVLDSTKDGLAQIAAWASTHSGYSAMHIVSHGEANDLMLGTVALTTANIASYQSELATIGQALSADGAILVYGCSVAGGSDGAALIGALAKDTQHTVAGSTDATGAASLGGNWTLEYSTDPLHVAALDVVGYQGLLTRPTNGTTSFDTLDGSTTVVPTGQTSLTVSNFLGWNFTMQMNTTSDGQNEMIIVEKDGSSSVETVDALSDGSKQITYFSVKPNDGSLFTLNSIGVVMDGYNSSFSGGNVVLVGYLNGSAVSGATLTSFVSDIDNSGSLVTFNVSSNSAFQGIDSFRVMAANGNNITGLIGIGAINATNFHFPGPVLTASGGSAAYSSGTGNAVTIDSGITLTDTAASTQTSATVAITGNFHSGEDVLAFSNTNATTYGNIVASYNSGTGVLTLTSSGSTATTAQWQAALGAVTYQDSSLSPNTSSRTLSFAITDSSSNTSSTVTRTVTVAADVAPVISNLNGDSGTFYAGGTAVHLDSGTAATVTDSDTTSFNGGNLTVQITANGHSAEDVLGMDTSGTVTTSNGTAVGSVISVAGVAIGSIATNGDGINGDSLIITFNANATTARVSTLVGALTYYNSATTPTTGNRTIQVEVNDGRGQYSSASSVTIAMNNNALVTTSGGSAAFTAGDNTASTPVVVDSGLSIVDHASSTLASGTVSITSNFHSGEDVLAFTNTSAATYGNIVASYNAATGVLTLASSGATATIAQWQAAMRAVTWTDTAVTPNTSTRTVSFQVTDGSSNSSPVATRTVTVTDVDQTPIVTTSGGSAAFTSGDSTTSTPVAVDSGLTLSDLDNTTLASATVAVTGNFHSSEDALAFTNTSAALFGNIVGSYNSSTGILTLSSSGATATLAQWQAALRSVTWTDSAVTPNTATRTVSFTVNDGTKNSAVATRQITVTATDQTPIVTASGGSAAFTAGDNTTSTPVVVDSGITLSDADNTTLASATVSITGNFHAAEDVLAFTNTSAVSFGNIVASYNSGTGVLTLTSAGATATLAQWQAALRSVTWTDTAVTPNTATRTISFSVSDGTKASTAATRTVTVASTDQTPIVTTSGGSAAFTSGDNTTSTPVAVDSGLTLSDLDNTTLASATVAVTGNFHSSEDALAFTNTSAALFGNIVGSYNSSTGILTLSSSGATATLAQWQAALRSVTWTDSAVMPNTATRTVSFTVNDGTKNSAVATRQITVTVTDQSPIVTASGGSAAFTAGDNTTSTPVVVDSGITLSDADNTTLASATVSITGNFHAAEDVLAFTNTSAVSFGNIVASYNSGTGVLTLTSAGATATLAQWQAALRSVTWTDTAVTPNTATRTISFSVSDGTKASTAATRTVTIASTDQTPVATTSGPGATYALGTPGATIAVDGGLTLSDLDNATLSSATVAITGNFHSAEDVLAFINTNASMYGNIAASYNSGTGVLTLTSSGATATVAQWQSALRAVTWADSATTPNSATRVISITVNDGTKSSAVVTRAISLSIPVPVVTGITAASDTGSSNSDGITSNTQPTFIGTALAGSTVTVYIDAVSVGTTTADGSGAWSFTPSTALGEGSHTVTAMATVGSVNSVISGGASMVIDTVAPSTPAGVALTAATDTGASHSDGLTNNNQPSLAGTAVAGSLVTVYIDGSAVGTTTADGSGAWQYNVSAPLPDGTHTASATATDTAGNVSSATAPWDFTVDTSAPQVQTVTAQNTLTGAQGQVGYNISFTKPVQSLSASELQALVTGNAQANIVSVTQINATTWQAVFNVQGTGTLTLGFVTGAINDVAGNALSGSLANVPVYQVAPAVTPVTPPAPSGNPGNTVSPVVSGNPAPAITLQPPPGTPMVTPIHDVTLSPIAPNIVLTALNGISKPALSSTGNLLPGAGNAALPLTLSVTPTFGAFVVPGGTASPSYIGSITSSPVAALEVRADVGSVGVVSGQSFNVSLPAGTILTRESVANLSVTVRQSNGMPLPSWIKFDPATGRFSGQPPAGWKQPVSIEIRVVDKQGHTGTSHLELKVGAPRGDTPSASLHSPSAKPGLDQQIAAHKTVFSERLMTPERQV